MQISVRKLEDQQEKYQAERLITTSFLHDWDEKEADENSKDPNTVMWGAFDEEGHMVSAVSTMRHDMSYEGEVISCGELHMVGTLPEARGCGAVRSVMKSVLHEYRDRGDLFALLIPFSFAFYRKFGFEEVSEMLVQKAAIAQFAPFRQELRAKQILSQEETDEARRLYESFAAGYNLADMKTDREWQYRDYGEFGSGGWQYGNRARYSYLFRDTDGVSHAYLTFVFAHGPEGPFTGRMEVTDIAFDCPEALHSVFGFIYGMRAKITGVDLELPRDVDISRFLPEPGDVERKLDGHFMARALNIDRILSSMQHPDESGSYSVHIEDKFLPENTGTYTVKLEDGEVTGVEKGIGPADISMTEETFCQLAVGLTGLDECLYREGTRLERDNPLLSKVFRRKKLYLR